MHLVITLTSSTVGFVTTTIPPSFNFVEELTSFPIIYKYISNIINVKQVLIKCIAVPTEMLRLDLNPNNKMFHKPNVC